MATQTQALNRTDQHFLAQAARAGMAEIKLGRLATERAARDEVRQFGRHMVQDHLQAHRELLQIAASMGAEVREELDPPHKDAVNRLSRLRGAPFDRAYVAQMVEDHRQAIAAFEQEARQGQDETLKQWAGRTLPILQRHLEMAEDMARPH